MFDAGIATLDAEGTLTYASDLRALAEQTEVRLLATAAHWADLHGALDGASENSLPGMERLISLGGEGTPEVAEFAPAEFGAVLAMSPLGAAKMIGDALDLRHRLPRLWSALEAGEVKPWVARKVADETRSLPMDQAAAVDEKVAPWAGSLSWGRMEAMIQAVVIEADPEAAAEAADAAQRAQGVWVSPSTDRGIKDIHIRTEAPAAIWFNASIQRLADGLKLLGDSDPVDVRRAKAVGIIAQPQRALDLFADVASCLQDTDTAAGSLGTHGPSDADNTRGLCAPRRVSRDGDRLSRRSDPRPPATLYVHLSDAVFDRGGSVARVEGIGPVLSGQVKEWLKGCQVTVKPVIDLNQQTPVDAYEIPDRMREAVLLRSPVDVFPYATSTSRNRDLDHTKDFVPKASGGPPGQTRPDNLGPMARFHHRIKTHGGWQVRQVFDGVFVWRSPHGHYFVVDHTGTRAIRRAASSESPPA